MGSVDTTEEQLPRRFGRLTLLRRLARGGMGEVYLASTGGIEGAERACVVKIIRREHASDASFRARFLDETRIQAQLQHPGVAQILEASTTEDDCPYAVVEYVEGRHLGEVLTRCAQLGVRLAWEDAVAIAISLGDALAHVHERTDAAGRPLEIAHRDLSPQNVMVGYAGDLKLIDFGTARGENRRCRTVSGVVYAKPGYVAPEVANQTPGGAPADLYAFGVMLWETAAGRRFLQGSPVEHQAAVGRGELRPPALAAEVGAPSELDDIIARLTAPRIVDRYPSARAAVSDLVLLLKRGASLANGDRSVRGRIAHTMQRLYPAEPARSRADFARRAAQARRLTPKEHGLPAPSPVPPQSELESAEGLLPGTRYRLVKPLAVGAMGEVFEACHVDLGRPVALKVLPRAASGSAERRQRFRTEARAIARLAHDNLVTLHDFGIAADGRFYYAMELLEGESLEARLRRGPLEWRRAVELAIQACAALEAAHGAGVIHRDITPANLFLTASGTVKLLDFGVARFATEPRAGGEAQPAVIGTPEYLAPEQAAGADADERADIYALGAVLYEMVTGLPPHLLGPRETLNVPALLTAKISATPPPPRVCAPEREIPPSLDHIIVQALSREPQRRFSSAAALKEALFASLNEPERRRRRRFAYVGVGAASAVAAFAALMAIGGGETLPTPDGAPWSVAVDELHRSQDATDAPRAPARLELPAPPESQLEERAPSLTAQAADVPSDADTDPSEAAVEAVSLEDAADADDRLEGARASQDDELTERIDAALERVRRGQRIEGYNVLKAIALEHPQHAGAQRGWSLSAIQVKAWGEALRAARSWAELEPSAEARLHLAKMEKATVRGDAIKTLEELLAEHPSYAEAQALLDEYRRDRVAQR
ncbi:MAG: serine/threonine protein kinase [Myxococcales bacterium]|nr:serine/threonine protein kinase [Myxococcales bacterium]